MLAIQGIIALRRFIVRQDSYLAWKYKRLELKQIWTDSWQMKVNRLEKAAVAVSTCLITLILIGTGCDRSVVELPPAEIDEISIDDDFARRWSEQIRDQVSATVDTQLQLTLWAADTLLADPVALDIDDNGRAFVTRTNRRKSTEFDIRQHPYWERASLSFQHVDDRRNFSTIP